MILTTVCQDIVKPNEITIFGNLEDSDWVYTDTDYIATLDKIVYNTFVDVETTASYDSEDPATNASKPHRPSLCCGLTDFTIKFLLEIGKSITVSISKQTNTFYVVYRDTNYINLDGAILFTQETINRFIELEKRKVEIHDKSLA